MLEEGAGTFIGQNKDITGQTIRGKIQVFDHFLKKTAHGLKIKKASRNREALYEKLFAY
jgi:hypothetical protein